MTKFGKVVSTVGIGVLGLGIAGIVVGMSAPSAGISSYKGFSSRTMTAMNGLKDELTRRFTDRQNISFGMERVIRPDARLHEGPTADRYPRFEEGKNIRHTKNGGYEMLVEGKWIPSQEIKPRMSPENEREQSAMDGFDREKVSAAIYTVGQFAYDKGSKPAPVTPQNNRANFVFGGYDDIRAKGPAYIHQDSVKAPDAYAVVDFARTAWRTGKVDFDGAGPDGWHFFAHRISAPDNSCLRCHGDAGDQKIRYESSAVRKVGDPVGMFVIALKK